jgi:hypothetical protein
MPVGIAHVQTFTASRPAYATLDRNARSAEMLEPCVDVIRGDRKCQVLHTLASMRRNRTAGCLEWCERGAAVEQQQHALAMYVEREQARRVEQHARAKHIDVKTSRAHEVFNVQRRFDDPAEPRCAQVSSRVSTRHAAVPAEHSLISWARR